MQEYILHDKMEGFLEELANPLKMLAFSFHS
jgi:hypothetical protein